MTDSAKKRLSQIHDRALLDDLTRISEEMGVSQTTLIAASVRALVKTWDECQEITLPFRIVPESIWNKVRNQS